MDMVIHINASFLLLRYQPPNLAISALYWKAWLLLLVVAAFNPQKIGIHHSFIHSFIRLFDKNRPNLISGDPNHNATKSSAL